jgi:DNA-binding response OmpR family regulator
VTKVLYIEDNDDNVYMLKMRLELLGDFEVLTAEDGERGCAMAVSERPDIILMDLEMPVVDGWSRPCVVFSRTANEVFHLGCAPAKSPSRLRRRG